MSWLVDIIQQEVVVWIRNLLGKRKRAYPNWAASTKSKSKRQKRRSRGKK